jgi:methyl-accepting chemotaxis protein
MDAEINSVSAEKSNKTAVELERLARKTLGSGEMAVTEIAQLRKVLDYFTEKLNTSIVGITNSSNVNREVVRSQENLIMQGDEIGHIVQSVVGIADQTNLLALNAAIEAARAGEYGKGFAVVADEVRNLAANAESAAKEISIVVNSIQEDIKSISLEVEAVGQTAEDEAEEIKKVVELSKMVESVAKDMKEAAEEYMGEANSQIGIIVEYITGAEQIASSSEQTASSANELVNSLREQAESLKEIQNAASLLSSISDFIREGQTTEDESNELSSAAEQLAATVQETNSAIQQILIAIQEIKDGSQQSVIAANQCDELINKVSQSTETSYRVAQKVEDIVVSRLGEFSESRGFIEKVFNGAELIGNKNLESAKRLKNLGRKAKQIDKIVDTIVNIAIQTNLLALNGAIEAARAGEYGKGFSVVAADVKNLANESSSSAEKIKDLVRNLQDQILVVGTSVEKAGRQAHAEFERGKEILEALNDIFKIYNEVYTQTKIVLQACEEQISSIEAGIEAAIEVKTQAEKTMDAAVNANRAAEEQSNSVDELAKIVEKIAHFAEEIEALS